jgi:cruciform cutting endonuclease 1
MPVDGGTPTTWLSKLTLAQLRRVAFAIGAPSSGTKPVLAKQIQRELGASDSTTAQNRPKKSTPASPRNLSIISIDMGIRNLAYAHLVSAPVSSGEAKEMLEPSTYERPSLVAWKRVVISGAPNGKVASTKLKKGHKSSDEVAATSLQAANGTTDEILTPEPEKEAFDPSTFANYAYNFVKSILSAHQPSHVLIEKQRFRSGGASAVQEWTIRVGVFEGMLHAVLKTLSEEYGLRVIVQGVDPGRVTRYWLEGRSAQKSQRIGSAKESKKAKIDIVGESFGSPDGGLVDVSREIRQGTPQDVGQVVDAFLARWEKKDRSRKDEGTQDVVKLDDLSDCLLQGVAWLNWQNKRQDVLRRGQEAFADDSAFVAVRSSHSKSVLKKLRTAKRETRTRKILRSQA